MSLSNQYSGQKVAKNGKKLFRQKENDHDENGNCNRRKCCQFQGHIEHDFRIRKQEKLLPKDSIKHADSGYQGWQKLQKNVVIPYKKYRKKPLTSEQKEHNRKLEDEGGK